MLALNDVTRMVNGEPVLAGVSLEIVSGRPMALVGLSRAAREAVARLLTGAERAQGGSLKLEGADLATARRSKGRVTRVGPAPPAASGKRVGALVGADGAARAGLSGHLNARLSELSPVQRMRLAIVQAVAARPGLLVIDAPASQLADDARDDLVAGLAALVAGFGGVVVLLASGADEAFGLGGDVAILHDGRLIQVGPVADVSAHPVDLHAALATSWPALNTLNLIARGGRYTLADGSSLQVPEDVSLPADGACTLAFHPGDVTLERASVGCLRFVVRAGAEQRRGRLTFLGVTFAGSSWLCPLASAVPHPGAVLNAFVDRSRLLAFDGSGRAVR